MKLFPIVAVVAVGIFASAGYVAGSLVADQHAADASAAQATVDTGHDAAAPVDPVDAALAEADAILDAAQTHGDAAAPEKTAPAEAAQPHAAAPGVPHLVKMESVTLPVRKRESVTFVVADVAVAVADAERAAHYMIPQNAALLQAAIENAMARAAETPVLRGVAIDSQLLSGTIKSDLKEEFADVEDVLFLTLYKHDVGFN
jgi:hypothetical protein